MNARRHRFRFGRRQPKPIAFDQLERVLSQPVETPEVSGSFEELVLGRVDAHRPFVDTHERKRIRWVRMSLIGLTLGLFATGVLGIRAGLLPFGQGAGPVSSVIETAQSESLQQVQSVSYLRDEALAMFESIKERQRRAQRQAPDRCNDIVWASSAVARPAPERGVCVGLSMREPVSAIHLASPSMNTRFVVFNDGLALPIAGTGSAPHIQIKRWPDNVQDSIMNLGLEGSSEHTLIGELPPWYGSDVVRLPRLIQVGTTPEEQPR